MSALLLALLAGATRLAAAADDRQTCEQGRREEAIAACTRLIGAQNAKPQDLIFAYMNRGIKYRIAADYDRAISDFDIAIKLDPKHAPAYGQRGWVYQFKRDHDRAIADANEAMRLDPKLDHPYVTRGNALRGKGDATSAIADYDTAIGLNPKNMLAHFYRGIAQREKGEIDRAIADLDAAIALDPKYAPAFGNRGYVYQLKRDYDRAIADADEAIRLDPKLDYPYFNRGYAWQMKGDPARAIENYDAAIRVNPNYAIALVNRGVLLRDKGDFDRAFADLDAAIKINPNYAPAYSARGRTHHLKRDYDRAIVDFGDAIRVNAKLDYPYLNRGISFQDKGDAARALADYDAAVAINPRYTVALNRRALLNESTGNFVNALADFRAALTIDPKLPNAPERIRRLEQKMAARSEPTPTAPAATETRVALVIGNSSYANVQKLPNPKGDAERIAATLKDVGFARVTLAFDLTREKLVDALKTFAGESARADWALVYFAGHGIEFDGKNFLIPIEAKLESDRDISFEAVALDQVLFSVEGARKLRLVILDACRDNPFAKTMSRGIGTRSVSRGLAQIEPEGATLVAYAAKHGQYAMDGEPGVNSPFVRALVKHLETPGIEISLLFRKVRDEVLASTGRRQEPFTYGSLPSEELFFRKP